MKRESKIYAININSPRICILTMMQISKKKIIGLSKGGKTRGKNRDRKLRVSKRKKKSWTGGRDELTAIN